MESKADNSKSPSKKKRIEHWQVISLLLAAYDIIAIHIAYFTALWARHDFIYSAIREDFLTRYQVFITPYSLVCVLVFAFFKLYAQISQYIPVHDINE